MNKVQLHDPEQQKLLAFNNKEKRIRAIGILFAILPIAFGFVWLIYTQNRVNKINQEYADIVSKKTIAKHDLDSIRELLNLQKAKTKVVKLESTGYVVQTDRDLEVRSQADSALALLLQTPGAVNSKLTLQYFRKSIDEDKIWLSLRGLGYRFKETASRPNVDAVRTNGIFYGAHAKLLDIKIIALTLIRSGCKIERVYGPSSTPDLIQIFGTPRPGSDTSLTVKKIMDATSLDQLNIGQQF